MADAKHDNNRIPTLLAVSNVDSSTPVVVEADPTTKRLLVDASISGGGTSMTDDAAFTPGITSVTPVGAMFDDTSPDSVNEGDGGVVRMSGNRNLYTTIRDAAGNERGLNINANGNTTPEGNVASGATDSGNPIKVGGKFNSTTPTLTDGQRGDFQQDSRGSLRSVLMVHGSGNPVTARADNADSVAESATANNISSIDRLTMYNGTSWDRVRGDTTNGLDVDVTRIIPGTTATSLGKAEDAAHSSGDVGVQMLAVRNDSLTPLAGTEGDYIPFSTDNEGALWVNLSTGQVDIGNEPSIKGTIAHDAADSTEPVKIGAKAETALSGITLVADGDRTDLYAGIDGVLITRPHANLEDLVSGNASNTDGASTQVIAASGSGVKTYLTDITITNTSSSNIYVELKDNTTVKWTFPVPANGGVTHNFTVPLAGSANVAWNFDPSAATTTVYCSAAGFKSKI